MAKYPMFEIWGADLNSLYDENPREPVFLEDAYTIEQARELVKQYQSHEDAAWIQEKETGKIIR